MRIVSLELKNFRCFTAARYDFLQPITLIEGQNGSGKTSIVEALAYASTLKSFRTSTTDDMIAASKTTTQESTLFIKLVVEDQGLEHILQLGYGQKKRSVKINGKKITNYKELVDHYRVVTMREEDIFIVTGYPEERRDFLDTALMQQEPGYAKIIRNYRSILKQRNALLAQTPAGMSLNQDSYRLWTERLLASGQEVRSSRKAYLAELEQEVNRLILQFFPELPALQLNYQGEEAGSTVDEIMLTHKERERAARRTLFGPHLDDIAIVYAGSHGLAKKYASRGQQKLIALLMKLAQVLLLRRSSICLLDDFMTDFDDKRLVALINLLIKSQAHLIFTVPVKNSPLMHHLKAYDYDLLEL